MHHNTPAQVHKKNSGECSVRPRLIDEIIEKVPKKTDNTVVSCFSFGCFLDYLVSSTPLFCVPVTGY